VDDAHLHWLKWACHDAVNKLMPIHVWPQKTKPTIFIVGL